MDSTDILEFLKTEVQPLPKDKLYGTRYLAAAELTDGTILPCVAFQAAEPLINLAIKRFDETRGTDEHRSIVASFTAKGNTVNEHDIRSLSKSRFAISAERIREIGGETNMSWTQFSATMKDGKVFHFGTRFNCEFFDMPDGYSASDIAKITPAVRGAPLPAKIFRDRIFYTCYLLNREYL